MEQNTQAPTTITVEDFEQAELIRHSTGIIHKLASNERLAIKDNIFNENGHVFIKGAGLRLSVPILQDAYIIDLAKYSVTLKDKSTGGKYSQDIGLGKEVSLSLAISFEIDPNNASINKLVKNKETYKSEIRITSEAIMRFLILQHFKMDQHDEIDLSKYYNQKSIVLDLIALKEGKLSPEKNNDKIIEAMSKLQNNYGIKLTRITITDMDLPREIQEIIEKNISEAAKRQRQAEQSRIELEVAQNEAQALKIRKLAEFEAMRAAGFNIEQIAEIEARKNAPEGSVSIFNTGSNSDRISDIVAGESAAKKTK